MNLRFKYLYKSRWGFNVNHNLINAGLTAREIATSDNSLHSLKPRKGDVSDLLSERVTRSGVCVCLRAVGLPCVIVHA